MLIRLTLGLATAASLTFSSVAAAQPATFALVSPGYAEPESPPVTTTTTTTTTTTNGNETVETVETVEAVDPVPEPTTTVVVRTTEGPAPAPAPAAPPPPQRSKRGLGMMITGLSLFTAVYLITAFSGAAIVDHCSTSASYDCRYLGRSLMIPVVGPFLATREIDSLSGRVAVAMFAGMGQATGLALGIGGAVLFSRSRRGVINANGLRLSRRGDLRVGTQSSLLGGGLRLSGRF